MRKYRITGLILVALLFNNASGFGQTNDLSNDDIEEFKARAGRMIDGFQANLGKIASKEVAEAIKQGHVRTTLESFIGEGDYYNDEEEGRDKIVQMEVSSLYREPRKRKITLKSYLTSLARLPYAKVEITSAETPRISNFYKQGDRYVATATIAQRFCGFKRIEGRLVKTYCDTTKKTFKVYLFKEMDMFGELWVVKLGDATVDDTTP